MHNEAYQEVKPIVPPARRKRQRPFFPRRARWSPIPKERPWREAAPSSECRESPSCGFPASSLPRKASHRRNKQDKKSSFPSPKIYCAAFFLRELFPK
jgi:hypothetical protein